MQLTPKKCVGALARFILVLAMAGAISQCAVAQGWPARTIRTIVPFTAGSGSDIIARTTMEALGARLGQTIVVENRVGAGGTIGAAVVARADPDGYTLLFDSSAHTSTPWVYKKLPYSVDDFVAVAMVASLPQVLVIAPSKGFKTVQDLVAWAKTNPGKATYASGGTGSATHLSVERFRLSAGFEGAHVPFKGGPEAITEVMMGRVDFYFVPALPALSLIQDGKLAALAVSSIRRAAVLPDVPTTTEAGYANSDYNFWVGVFAPVKTARDIVERINREVAAVLGSAEIVARLSRAGAEPLPMTAAEFETLRRTELAANETLVKSIGIAGSEN